MIIKHILIVFICFLFISKQDVNAQTLHAVIFASTVDWKVKDGNNIIFSQLVEEMNRIGEYTGMDVKLDTCRYDNFNLRKAKSIINNINPSSNDCILVFFLGHGYRWDQTSSIWPNLTFSNKSFIADNEKDLVSWNEKKIFNILNAKGARFVGLFAEACNNSVGTQSYASNNNSRTNDLNNVLSIEKYKSLFLDTKGTILLSSSKAGQVSYVNSAEGGLFTSRFLQALHEQTASNDSEQPNWVSILHKAKYETINRAKSESLVQVPQYKIDVTYNRLYLQYEVADNLLAKGYSCTNSVIDNYDNLMSLVSELDNGISMEEIKFDCYKMEEKGLLLLYDLKERDYNQKRVNNRLIQFYRTKPQKEPIREEINRLIIENNN